MRLFIFALLTAACNAPPVPDELPEPAATLATSGSADFIDGLERQGRQAIPRLEQVARSHDVMTVRGEAILALARIEAPEAELALARLTDEADDALVQTWAAAARVQRADTLDEVIALAPLAQRFSALKRPVKMKIEALPAGSFSVMNAMDLIQADPSLQNMLVPMISERPGPEVVAAMLQHPSTQGRQLAAGLLASMSQNDTSIRSDILDGFAYYPEASQAPWSGGALYIPSAAWNRSEAAELVGSLVSWHLFCERTGAKAEQQNIDNNLRSVGLLGQAGFSGGLYGTTDALLEAWGNNQGSRALLSILRDHGLDRDPHYRSILNKVEASR